MAADNFLDDKKTNRNCVVTIPAHFSHQQRQSTIDAIKIAGLKLLSLLEEPVAAALSVGIANYINADKKHILIYDFGGGTLDLTVLKFENGTFETVALAGDFFCGGQDIDNHLIQRMMDKYANTPNAEDIEGKPKYKAHFK